MQQLKYQAFYKKSGFTVIELVIVMAIVALLTGLTTINFIKPQTSATTQSAINTLIADIKEQQIKAMAGDSEDSTGATPAQPHGIYLEANKYTLFRGASYNPSEPNNFAVNLETGLTLSTTFPSSQLVFTKRSGEITSYSAGSDTITVTNSQSGEQKTITINRYGAITIN